MRLRTPPGRAGRPWLVRRLEIARTGAQVLDEKRRALLRELGRIEPVVAEAREDWEVTAREAAEWLDRAAVLSGGRRLRLALHHCGTTAELRVSWRNALGVVYPDDPQLIVKEAEGVVGVGGSAALPIALGAHRRALEAAVRYSVIQGAHDRISAELAATARRLRAIEKRWIPSHEEALYALDLAMDEAEREDAVRTRWAVRRRADGEGAGQP
jgi:V/A-type H+-transporting ATPase subunit D